MFWRRRGASVAATMVDASVETERPQTCHVATMTDMIGDDETYAEYEEPCEYYTPLVEYTGCCEYHAPPAEFPGWCEYYAYREQAAYAYPYSANAAE
jgi:hypothetical protein